MTRSSAREIAIHCSYSLGFSHESADEFLAVRLNKENFQRWSQESALYKEYPNEKQLQYIKELVRGVANHGPELDQYIAQYAKDWSFARIPLPAAAIMRVAMYEILYMPDIPAAAAINDAVEIAKKYEDFLSPHICVVFIFQITVNTMTFRTFHHHYLMNSDTFQKR